MLCGGKHYIGGKHASKGSMGDAGGMWRYARGHGNASTQAAEVVAMTIDRGGPFLGLELLQMAMMH